HNTSASAYQLSSTGETRGESRLQPSPASKHRFFLGTALHFPSKPNTTQSFFSAFFLHTRSFLNTSNQYRTIQPIAPGLAVAVRLRPAEQFLFNVVVRSEAISTSSLLFTPSKSLRRTIAGPATPLFACLVHCSPLLQNQNSKAKPSG
ncbi:hypothetical protein LB507_000962, partial [Fusarium sp. FIESC RH6]